VSAVKLTAELLGNLDKIYDSVSKKISDWHKKKRNGKILRLLDLPEVSMIETSEGNFGIGHMKGISSWGNDYYLFAKPSDTQNISQLRALADKNDYLALEALANNNNFKRKSAWDKKPYFFDRDLNQEHLIVTDAYDSGTYADTLLYSGLFTMYPINVYQTCSPSDVFVANSGYPVPFGYCIVRNEVSFVGLIVLLSKLADTIINQSSFALDKISPASKQSFADVLEEFQDEIQGTWYKAKSEKRSDGKEITVYVHIPTVLALYIAERKAGLR